MKRSTRLLLLCTTLLGLAACAAEGDDTSAPPGDDVVDPPDDPPPGIRHGDVCVAPAYDCGAATGLICVVDQIGDSQGMCRAACGSFSDCLSNGDVTERFDTACCDIDNGTQVCGQTDDWPVGACD